MAFKIIAKKKQCISIQPKNGNYTSRKTIAIPQSSHIVWYFGLHFLRRMYLPNKFMVLDILFRYGPAFFLLVNNFTSILQLFTTIDQIKDKLLTPVIQDGEEFDFIIVGGGSSGCTLANRLSESYRVLLLEAGGVPNPIISVPIWSFLLNNRPTIDWQYRTVPQKHAAFGLNNNVMFWGSGKGLGGSSLVNAAIYLRGNVQGFDTIAENVQDPKWSLSNILRYYQNIEDYHGFFSDEGISHGYGGEVSVETAYTVPFIDNLLKAGEELGYQVRDPNGNGPITEGFAPMDFYHKFGRKHDAYSSSLFPILPRTNLIIRKFSFVRHLLLNGTTAYGVEYERYDSTFKAFAKKEVILCAGTFQNPKLLMLAGIGPKEHLKELNIPLKVDLPVGKLLEDKYGALIGPFVVDDGKSFKETRDVTIFSWIRWFFSGTGTIATGRTEATFQIISDFAKSEGRLNIPDVHSYILAYSPGIFFDAIAKSTLNFNEKSMRYFNSVRGQDTFFQLVAISSPFSRGTLRLADKNPNSHPIIDANYLADPRDVKTLVDGLKFAVNLVEGTSAFKEIHAHLIGTSFPGCDKFSFKSDSYFECLGRHTTVSAFKYSGTTPIGKNQSDPNAIVDSRFRVLGTNKLRVVGGSVIRESIASVNDITCRILGTFAADLIKEDW